MLVDFALEAMQLALAGACPHMCNSDQGSQLTSPLSTQLLLAHGIRMSMDGKVKCPHKIGSSAFPVLINSNG